MMEYKLISGTDVYAVTKAVNESLAAGWEPLGSVAVCGGQGAYILTVFYVQAMTRSVKPAEKKESNAAGSTDTLETLPR